MPHGGEQPKRNSISVQNKRKQNA
jgi:hypothetical protein